MKSGKRSFNRKSLHHIGSGQNPYEQAISIIGKTLSVFDEDNLIPCFGFGDGNSIYKSSCFQIAYVSKLQTWLCFFLVFFPLSASTHDQDVFSFHSDERFCHGFEEVLSRYRDIVPRLRLAGAAFTNNLTLHFWIRLSMTRCIYVTGPTSFAPIIEMAMTIVEQSGGQYHVLLIIADGQVFLIHISQDWKEDFFKLVQACTSHQMFHWQLSH